MLTKSTMGIIFPNMHDSLIPAMTGHRAMASVPFGGRYRMIDFNLSTMANAGIETIGVIVKKNYQSLMDHLGNGREWDLCRKRGGLTIFPPNGENSVYHGRIEALYNIIEYLKYQKEELIVLADCDAVCNLDFDDIITKHCAKGADVTIVYNKENLTEGLSKDNVCLSVDATDRITEMMINDYHLGSKNMSLDVFVINRELLIDIVKDAYTRGFTMFDRDVLAKSLKVMNVIGYEYKGPCSRIYDMKSYFDANMELLNVDHLNDLFRPESPIYTKIRDGAPVRYALDSKVKCCTSADGCIIEGEAENCIMFRGVRIGKGAKVKNCVLMQDTIVEENAQMEYVITDKNVVVGKGQTLNGSANYPVFIGKNAKV